MQLPATDLEKLKIYFADQPVKRAFLFGSYSRGAADDQSDVDILVELDHSKPVGLHFIRMGLDLEELLQRKVDLVTNKGLSPHVLPFVEKDKQLIYARA